MTHFSEQLPPPLDKRRFKTERPKVLIRATAVGAVGLMAASGFYIANKIEENDRSVKAAQARHAKIIADARNAATATIEQQRLNPSIVKAIGGVLVIEEGKILASSPNFLNIASAPGNVMVKPHQRLVVFNPKLVNNTYQFADSCGPKDKNNFITSAEVAPHTQWISTKVTNAPRLFNPKLSFEAVTIDKNTAQTFNQKGNEVNCAVVFDVTQLPMLNQYMDKIQAAKM